MISCNIATGIREQGWTTVDFAMSEADRAHYAALANGIITLAQNSTEVSEAMRFEIVPPAHDGRVRTGLYGVSGALNSGDDKLWLHAGFQSRGHAAGVIPEWRQPRELKEFWPAHEDMLHRVQKGMTAAVLALGAPAVRGVLFPPEIWSTNIHLRTVRYIDAITAGAGSELVAGHTDLGICSLHVYETHEGYIAGGPYPPRLIRAEDTPARRAAVRHIRESKLAPMTASVDEAVFFLGAGWHGLPDRVMPDTLRDLPACYHAGFRPDADAAHASPYAQRVTAGRSDRVSVIAFGQPNTVMLQSDKYQIPTVVQCRPEYAC